jgi:hypothetical protein
MMTEKERLEKLFEIVVNAAKFSRRCPTNEELDGAITAACGLPELARMGRILIEISGRNYRTVTILMGAHAGKRTAPDPGKNRPWLTIGVNSSKQKPKTSDVDELSVKKKFDPVAHREARHYRTDFMPT